MVVHLAANLKEILPWIWIIFTMDTSSVQQDVLLDDRSSNGVPNTSEEVLDCKAKLDLPVTRDEINSKLFHVNFSTTYFVVWVMLKDLVLEVRNLLYSSMQSHSLHQTTLHMRKPFHFKTYSFKTNPDCSLNYC